MFKSGAKRLTGTELESPRSLSSDDVQVVCGSSKKLNACGGQSATVPKTDTYNIRCCSDTEKSGWLKKSFCDVWGESDNDGECFGAGTFDQAVTKCSDNGARLCTYNEIVSHCTQGSGCGYDKSFVWVVTETAEVVCGSSKKLNACGGQSATVPKTDTYNIRCCSDTEKSGWLKKSFCDVWGESDNDGECFGAGTFDQAVTKCSDNGARLCTYNEIVSHCTQGSGCGYDKSFVWAAI